MQLATFRLSVELLEQLLNLPEGAKVMGVEAGIRDRDIRVWVTGDMFPEVDKGHLAPECQPSFITYTKYLDGHRQDVAEFEDWGMPEDL